MAYYEDKTVTRSTDVHRVDAEKYKPTTKGLDPTELTYEQLQAEAQREDSGMFQNMPPTTRERFANIDENTFALLADYAERNDVRGQINTQNERYIQQDRDYQIASTKQAQYDQNAEWERKVQSWQDGMEKLGQGQEAAENMGDIAEMAAVLLNQEGDSEEAVAARRQAAITFQQFQQQLAPHIQTLLGEDWWANNYQAINANLPDDLADGYQGSDISDGLGALVSRGGNNAMQALGWATQTRPGDYLIDILQTAEQAGANTLAGFRAALDRDDGISAYDALKFSGANITGLPDAMQQAITPGMSNEYADGPRILVTSDGRELTFDIDGDGTVNLREAVGRSNELSGTGEALASGLGTITGNRLNTGTVERFVGLADTVGLAAIDPTSWVTLGATGRARVGLRTLAESSDSAANRAFLQLRNGIRAADLDDAARRGMQAQFARDAYQSALRQDLKPSVVSRLRRQAKEADELLEQYIERQVDLTTKAIERGAMPGIRVGGTTVVPTRRLLEAMNRINPTLANNSRWILRSPAMQELQNVDEMVEFIHTYDGAAVPAHIKEQMREWDVVANQMALQPEAFLYDALTADPNAFDEILAFGRALLGDDAVKGWDDIADRALSGQARRVEPPLEGSVGRRAARKPEAPMVVDPQALPDTPAGPNQNTIPRDRTPAPEGRTLTPDTPEGLDTAYPQSYPANSATRPAARGEELSLENMRRSLGGEAPPSDIPGAYTELPPTSTRGEELTTSALQRRAEELEGIEPGTPPGRGPLEIPSDTPDYFQDRLLEATEDTAARTAREGAGPIDTRGDAVTGQQDRLIESPEDALRRAQNERTMSRPSPNEEYEALSETAQSRLDLVVGDGRQLDAEQLARVKANMDIVEQPQRWFNEELGLVSNTVLYGTETLAGRIYTRFMNAISPRARVRQLDKAVARQMDQAATEADSLRRLAHHHAEMLDINPMRESQLVTRVTEELSDVRVTGLRRLRSSKEELAAANTKWQRIVDSALSDPEGVSAHVQREMAAGHTETAKLITALNSITDDVIEYSAAAGGDIPGIIERKLARIINPDNEEFARNAMAADPTNTDLERIFRDMGLIGDESEIASSVSVTGPGPRIKQGDFLKEQTYRDNLESIYEVNAAARADLKEAGLDAPDFQLYNDNPVTAAMMRSRSAQEARVYVDMLSSMTDVTGPTGRPLGYFAETADDKASIKLQRAADEAAFGGDLEFREFPMPNGGSYYVEKTVADEIDRTRRIVGSNQDHTAMRDLADAHNNIWAIFATVLNPAFHARNGVGNAFNMFLAGVNNPKVFADALRIQRLESQLHARMKTNGLTFDQAMGEIGFSQADEMIIRDIRNFDLASSNRVTDLLNEYDPLSMESGQKFTTNRPVRAGRAVGNLIEGNARIALYLDGVNKGMSPAAASARVREFLFDYSDLTELEANKLRTIARFYTFTRKNTALQARVLAATPGRIVNGQRIVQEFQDGLMGIAGYERDESGELQPPEWMEGGSMYTKGGELGFAAGMETPFAAFLETTNTLAGIAKIPPYMFRIAASDEGSREEAQQSVRETLGLFVGGPVESIKTAFELATNQDLFTGQDLDYQDRTLVDKVTRFTNVLFPVGSLVDRHLEGFGVYENLGIMQDETDRDGDGIPDRPDRNQGWDRLVNLFSGMQLYYDETKPGEREQEEMLAMIRDMDDALYDVQQEIPREERVTMADLIEAGEVIGRNDVLTHILYTGRVPGDFTPEDYEWLDRILPESQQRALGIDIAGDYGETSGSELTPEEAMKRAQERITAAEVMGVQLTDEMKEDILKAALGLSMTELENDVNVEAWRTYNSYRDEALAEGDIEGAAQANREFTAEVLELMNMGSLDSFVAANPVLTWFDRDIANMREAGWTEEQIAAEVVDGLSRERKAIVFGEDSLDMEFSYDPYTEDQLKSMDTAIKKEVSQMNWLWLYQFGREPTNEERDFYLAQVFFTAPEQRRVGVDTYSAPSRDNVTSDETYMIRQAQEAELLDNAAGTNFGAAVAAADS